MADLSGYVRYPGSTPGYSVFFYMAVLRENPHGGTAKNCNHKILTDNWDEACGKIMPGVFKKQAYTQKQSFSCGISACNLFGSRWHNPSGVTKNRNRDGETKEVTVC